MTTPIEWQARLTRELMIGERVLWQGQPARKWLAPAFGIWLFAIPWTVFSLFWEAMALAPWWATGQRDAVLTGFGIVMPIFGLPFIVVGFGMLWMPFRTIGRAGETLYALTDRRLIRIVAGKSIEQTSVFLDRIGPIETRERADGWGDLKIQTRSRVDSDGDRITETFELTGVPEVAKLRRLVVERQ